MKIRLITDADVPAVSAMMRRLSGEFIVHESSPESAAAFARENDVDGIRAFVAAGTVYRVAETDGAIAGFIAMRDNKHVFHMFVDKPYHRQGVARALWDVARETAMAAGNPGIFTVNSSNHALPVYEAFGFVRTDTTQCKNGIYFNPMQFDGRSRD